MVDDRPLYVNVALFGVRLTGGRWALVQLGQNPIPEPEYSRRTDNRTGWTFYRITDVDWNPVAVFSRRPTSQEVDTFLQFWFDGRGWRILSQGFRSRTWNALLGLPAPDKLQAQSSEPRK